MSVIEFPTSGFDRAMTSTEDPELLAHYSAHCRRTLEDLAFTKSRLDVFLEGHEYHVVYHLIGVIQERVEAIVDVEQMSESHIPAILRCLKDCHADLNYVLSMIHRNAS